MIPQIYQVYVYEIENKLSVLGNRLRTSTYEEDKLEALESIAKYSHSFSLSVGAICLKDVFCAVQELDDVSLIFLILRNVMGGQSSDELIEVLFSDKECQDAFFSMKNQNKVECIRIVGCPSFFKRIESDHRVTNLLVELFKEGFLDVVNSFINYSTLLKESLNVNFLTSLLTALKEAVYSKKGKKCAQYRNILLSVLRNSKKNADVFISERHHLLPHMLLAIEGELLAFTVYPLLIEARNVTDALFIPEVIRRAVKEKRYNVLRYYTSQETTTAVLLRYLDFEMLGVDAESDWNALYLYEKYISIIKPQGVRHCGYKTALILLQYNYDAVLSSVYTDITSGKLSTELLIYIASKFDDIGAISEYLIQGYEKPETNDIAALCALILITHSFKFDASSVAVVLKTFRERLIKKELINDFYTEILLGSISEIIKADLSNRILCSSAEALEIDFENSKDHKIEPEKPEQHILARSSVLSDVLKSFKQEKKHETYDL